MWLEPGAMVVEFSDSGHLTDPLTGRLVPRLDSTGGRGLYLVHQLCDLVQVRSSPGGTTVRVITWL
jgi:anti-sigma regulatory factor (Ser/Thr protein kinase)